MLVPALLAALVDTETFGDDRQLSFDERAVGVALALRVPMLLAVARAVAATALVRAVGWYGRRREASISCLDTNDRKPLFLRGRRLCHIYGSDYWRAEEQKMEAISGADVGQEMESYFIRGHGPFAGVQGSAPLGDSGMPEACADDAPLENACPTCQTQANLRRWTG